MRKFEFQVLDNNQNIVDRFILDTVITPSGFGFSQKIDIVETKTIDYVVDRGVKRKEIKISIIFSEPQSYLKVNKFREWYCKNISKKVVLRYNDGNLTRYMNIAIKEFDITEIDTGMNTVPVTIQPLSPFYLLKHNAITFAEKIENKEYPYKYPHAYGGGQFTDNIIANEFFEPIPLSVRVKGPIVDPAVSLKNEANEIYATVCFKNTVLLEGESVLIDAINTRIMRFNNNGNIGEDYYNFIDKSKNTFLYATPGKSKLIANIDKESEAQITASYMQYVL